MVFRKWPYFRCWSLNMIVGTVNLVNTAARCRSLLAHLSWSQSPSFVVVPLPLQSVFSDRPHLRDSFSRASYRRLQWVIAQDSESKLNTSPGLRRSIPLGRMQSAKKIRTQLSMSTESAIAWDSADKLLRHFRGFHDFHTMTPTGASCPLCRACEVA